MTNWIKEEKGNMEMACITAKEDLKKLGIIGLVKVTYKPAKLSDFKRKADVYDCLEIDPSENLTDEELTELLDWWCRVREYKIYENLSIELVDGNIDGTTDNEGIKLEKRGLTLRDSLENIVNKEMKQNSLTIEEIKIINI